MVKRFFQFIGDAVDLVLSSIEDIIWQTAPAEQQISLEQKRDTMELGEMTGDVGDIIALAEQAGRQLNVLQKRKQQLEAKAKRMLAEGKDQAAMALAKQVAAVDEMVAQQEAAVAKALKDKEAARAFLEARELQRQLDWLQDDAVILQDHSNRVAGSMLERKKSLAELGTASRRSIRTRLNRTVQQQASRIAGQTEAVDQILTLRGHELMAEQTDMTASEEAVFARLKREVGGETSASALESTEAAA